VPLFSRPREIELPAPYGTQTQYIIPHSETLTLAQFLQNKEVTLIEVRGTWPARKPFSATADSTRWRAWVG